MNEKRIEILKEQIDRIYRDGQCYPEDDDLIECLNHCIELLRKEPQQ